MSKTGPPPSPLGNPPREGQLEFRRSLEIKNRAGAEVEGVHGAGRPAVSGSSLRSNSGRVCEIEPKFPNPAWGGVGSQQKQEQKRGASSSSAPPPRVTGAASPFLPSARHPSTKSQQLDHPPLRHPPSSSPPLRTKAQPCECSLCRQRKEKAPASEERRGRKAMGKRRGKQSGVLLRTAKAWPGEAVKTKGRR